MLTSMTPSAGPATRSQLRVFENSRRRALSRTGISRAEATERTGPTRVPHGGSRPIVTDRPRSDAATTVHDGSPDRSPCWRVSNWFTCHPFPCAVRFPRSPTRVTTYCRLRLVAMRHHEDHTSNITVIRQQLPRETPAGLETCWYVQNRHTLPVVAP